MKSLTKKALSLAMAIAMAGSFAVSAATINITDADANAENGINVADTETAMVKVPFTTDITDQLTVLLYKVDTENDLGPTEGNIGYINQVAANDTDIIVTETVGEGDEAKTVTSFSFPMNDDNVTEGKINPGTYKILVGGTGITTAMEAGVLVVTEQQATIVWGDVDGVTGVSLNDAIMVLKKSMNASFELTNAAAADVDGVTGVSLNDAIMVLKKSMNANFTFPVE